MSSDRKSKQGRRDASDKEVHGFKAPGAPTKQGRHWAGPKDWSNGGVPLSGDPRRDKSNDEGREFRTPSAPAESSEVQKKGYGSSPKTAGALSEHPILLSAIDGFVRSNSNFESSVVINATVDALEACTVLKEVFTLPLKQQLFSLDASLRWALFLSLAPGRAVHEGDTMFSQAAPFSVQEAYALIAAIYDIGIQETVWVHFADDEDDEDSEGDEGEDDEGGTGRV